MYSKGFQTAQLYNLIWASAGCILTFTTLWVNSADYKLMTFFLFFQENRIWQYMQNAYTGDNLPVLFFWNLEKHFNTSFAENFTQHA